MARELMCDRPGCHYFCMRWVEMIRHLMHEHGERWGYLSMPVQPSAPRTGDSYGPPLDRDHPKAKRGGQ